MFSVVLWFYSFDYPSRCLNRSFSLIGSQSNSLHLQLFLFTFYNRFWMQINHRSAFFHHSGHCASLQDAEGCRCGVLRRHSDQIQAYEQATSKPTDCRKPCALGYRNISRGRVFCGNENNTRIDSYPVSIHVFVGRETIGYERGWRCTGCDGKRSRKTGDVATSCWSLPMRPRAPQSTLVSNLFSSEKQTDSAELNTSVTHEMQSQLEANAFNYCHALSLMSLTRY